MDSDRSSRRRCGQGQTIGILGTDVGALDFYSKTDRIPKAVRDALGKAIGLRNAMTDTQRQIDDRRRQVTDISQEQERIRSAVLAKQPVSLRNYPGIIERLCLDEMSRQQTSSPASDK